MQTEKPKIELYQVRNFGQKFSATFDFLRENFRLWLRACTYLILPLCLFQGLAMETMIGGVMGLYTDGIMGTSTVDPSTGMLVRLGASYFVLFLCLTVGSVLLASICYAMMKYYRTSPNRLRGVSLHDLKPLIIQSVKRALVLGFLLFGIWLVVGIGSIVFSVMTYAVGLMFFVIIALIVFMIPLSLAMPVYIFEDDETVFGAINRAISLGFHAFWPLLGLMIVIGLLANILQTVTTLPWYALFLVKMVMTVADEGSNTVVSSPVYSFAEYLMSVVMSFGMYLTMSLSTIALAYQYGSVAEEMDGLSVEDDIEHFEQLAEEDKDIENFDRL
ncbi:MAG: hypothetical protein K6A82_02005 [Prevotella sp.]|nr:hypothetical protein [Prevotella sp.]